jgi:hypothetical protein
LPDILIHMHIPKTAGTSVREALRRCLSPDEILEWYPKNPYTVDAWIPEFRELLERRPRTRVVTGHFVYGLHRAMENTTYKYFTVFRDPVSRIVSHYVHDIHHGLRFIDSQLVKRLITAQNISDYVSEQPVSYFYNDLHARFVSGIYDSDFLGMSSDEIFETCTQIVDRDFLAVAGQQDLATGLLPVFQTLGFSAPEIGSENSRGRHHPSEVLLPDDFARLRELNRLDYRLVCHLAPDAIPPASCGGLQDTLDRFRELQLNSFRRAIVNLLEVNKVLEQRAFPKTS